MEISNMEIDIYSSRVFWFYLILFVSFLSCEYFVYILTIKNIKNRKGVITIKQNKNLPLDPGFGTIWRILENIDRYSTEKRTEKINCYRVKAEQMIYDKNGLLKKINKPLIIQVWLTDKQKPEKNCICEIYIEEDCPFIGLPFMKQHKHRKKL